MDIAKLDTRTAATEGRDMVVVDAEGKETDIILTLIGEDSSGYVKAIKEAREILNDMPEDIDGQVERLEDSTMCKIVACTTNMTGLEDGGKPVDFSIENVTMLYRAAPYVAMQALNFIKMRSNFLTSA